MMLPKGPPRYRSPLHLRFIATLPDIVWVMRTYGDDWQKWLLRLAGDVQSQAHHITYVQSKARGLKACDSLTVPLHPINHDALHRAGNERLWWPFDPEPVASFCWGLSIRAGRVHELEAAE